MIYRISKKVSFSAAHYLPYVEEGHPCRNTHGHNYEVEAVIEGGELEKGVLLDFRDLSESLEALTRIYDHSLLNEHLTNPTCENLALSFFHALKIMTNLEELEGGPRLRRLRVSEGMTSWAEVEE